MSLRALVLLASLLHAAPAMADLFPDNDKARVLLKQALALEAEGKGNEAFDRFRDAALADPKASTPVAHIAYLLYVSSKAAPAKEAPEQRQQAEAAAKAALQLDERDPLAMEVLRALADSQPQARHQPSSAATKAVNEGELLFHDKKFAEAAVKYEQAIALDPAYAEAVLLLGDCYFMEGDMARAEVSFRKATAIDPLYGSAWRFLFDAQMHQGKFKDAEASAISAIAAAPSERQSWLRMNTLLGKWGNQLTPFRLVPHASLGKKNEIAVDKAALETDSAVWLAYGLALAKGAEDMPKASQFERDLYTWKTTMATLKELGNSGEIKDDGLRAMLRFHKAGQLEAALFLLNYREAYRPDFEAWKKANPGAIKNFIETFQVGI